jgi:hypothetical protein
MQVEELRNSPLPFSHLSFSNDGNSLLAVAESKVFVLNAYNGNVVRKFSNGTPEGGQAPEAALSADGQFVMSGGFLLGPGTYGNRHIVYKGGGGDVQAQANVHIL